MIISLDLLSPPLDKLKLEKKICVQIPEYMLPHTKTVISLLTKELPDATFSILADSSMSDCCVDLIAASHVETDAILKIGGTCVEFFDKASVSLYHIPVIKTNVLDLTKKIEELLIQNGSCAYEFISSITAFSTNLNHKSSPKLKDRDNIPTLRIFFEEVWWKSHLNMLKFKLSEKILSYRFDFESNEFVFCDHRKEKSKRFAVISKISKKSPIGIIVHSTDPSHSLLAKKLNSFLHSQGFPSYILSIGKISAAKLGNFAEFKAFVVIGCLESCFLGKSADLMFPLITPFEMLCIAGLLDFWHDEYTNDNESILKTLDLEKKNTLNCSELNELYDKKARSQQLGTFNNDFSSMILTNKTFSGLTNDDISSDGLILSGFHGVPQSYSNKL